MASVTELVKGIISSHGVVVFSKSYCPFCTQSKNLLNSLSAKYKLIELDEESNGSAMQSAIKSLYRQNTVPAIFIKGQLVGGNSDLQSLHQQNKLSAMLQSAATL
mmetsp:Transcript_3409/g.9250  ORF Transcript_3409/g.9250 Transcript_3409/m.9250 type:complete len:105 (+) Transcript_3409:101-415(+)|eukprot:CAMPEP_0119130804 /NCGR_PEP_ID=MMETSP1310-20130426/8799_1 /TAXON_ID=464262 /ORGANISM="Genus nov. species nov., Strain RCC2339" /LENGTH=104 /DNA_ID=CAMNT_0007121339 /DNA_START=53 /DNA_END=367 /DNA_ORIENTATION=+